MPQSVDEFDKDDIDPLLKAWAHDLPEPPADQVEQLLIQLRNTPVLPLKSSRVRLVVLGGMAAAILAIIAGGLVLLASFGPGNQSEVAVAVPSVTSAQVAPTDTLVPVATATFAPTASATLAPTLTATSGPIFTPTTLTLTNNSATTGPAVIQAAAEPPTATIDDAPRNPVPPVKTPVAPPKPATATSLPATATVSVEPPKVAANSNLTVTGAITALDANGLSLNTLAERVILNPATKISSNKNPVPFSALSIGQYVTVEASRNAQGQLVALQIAIVVRQPPKVNPPQ